MIIVDNNNSKMNNTTINHLNNTTINNTINKDESMTMDMSSLNATMTNKELMLELILLNYHVILNSYY